ncbi:hypothetical protein CK231_23795 [Mesorhizobium loti]|uniref:Uncharacterized protein n=1 Tax=Rhizobium loti TaxID=381 RepID=A0A1A5J665_RHILI|nr:hypothetical protein MesloDRAFT_1546 [Mesorhizobium japonicum R7A]OBP70990.1 hypothetical protein BAE41_19380 [Mesorhizobium loti]OBP75156.1 hypothetical protein BAE42_05990 [Mesorhizobium loti]OBP76569.1 hypothetical protein BAE39_10660 [Mesorhizobium loti]OBP86731.1 hypothetical protein BAE38_19390 [Mesorhizobium loti]
MGAVIDFYKGSRSISQSKMLPPDDPDWKLTQLVDESRRLKIRICELDRLIDRELAWSDEPLLDG